ncbi:hypothetical protein [Hyella patelloides]|nr:hypothetical protein [Hyella patelloides]
MEKRLCSCPLASDNLRNSLVLAGFFKAWAVVVWGNTPKISWKSRQNFS